MSYRDELIAEAAILKREARKHDNWQANALGMFFGASILLGCILAVVVGMTEAEIENRLGIWVVIWPIVAAVLYGWYSKKRGEELRWKHHEISEELKKLDNN